MEEERNLNEEQNNIIEVGMAEMKVSQAPNILVTRGLGSCVGIVLYDSVKKIGGLAHPMLPDIETAKIKTNQSKFVNSVVYKMFEDLRRQGCLKSMLRAKLFGGGHMFSAIPSQSMFNIGAKNIEMSKDILKSLGIRLIGEDTGGNYGRTIEVDLSTGVVKIKTIFHGEKEI